MALASTTSSSHTRLLHRFSPPLPPPSSLARRRGARPRGYVRFAVRWEGRALAPRALLGGFSDVDASGSDDDEDAHGALLGGHQPAQEDEDVLELAAASSSGPERWDVLGLGQAMVDFSGMMDDEFLERLGIEKGTRKVVNHEERGRVLHAMDVAATRLLPEAHCPTRLWL